MTRSSASTPEAAPSDSGEPALGRSRRNRRRQRRLQPDVLAVIAVGGTLGATVRFKLAEALRDRGIEPRERVVSVLSRCQSFQVDAGFRRYQHARDRDSVTTQ
jgi:hypothetical protein